MIPAFKRIKVSITAAKPLPGKAFVHETSQKAPFAGGKTKFPAENSRMSHI